MNKLPDGVSSMKTETKLSGAEALVIVAIIVCGTMIYFNSGGDNAEQTFGDTNLPKNCRAIVADNVDGFNAGRYTARAVVDAIDRNCGALGYAWENNPGNGGNSAKKLREAILGDGGAPGAPAPMPLHNYREHPSYLALPPKSRIEVDGAVAKWRLKEASK